MSSGKKIDYSQTHFAEISSSGSGNVGSYINSQPLEVGVMQASYSKSYPIKENPHKFYGDM
ncbi:13646_t:CDS:2, partial [Acaulospora colombiana]